MPHIALPEGLPGITSGFAFRPETARPMRELAEVLLRGAKCLQPSLRDAEVMHGTTSRAGILHAEGQKTLPLEATHRGIGRASTQRTPAALGDFLPNAPDRRFALQAKDGQHDE